MSSLEAIVITVVRKISRNKDLTRVNATIHIAIGLLVL